jgi:Xaa-Pro aminopeptidase
VEDLKVYQEVEGYVEGIKVPFQRLMQRLDPKRIAVNYSKDSEICDGLTHGMYLTLVDLLSGIGFESRLESAEAIVSRLRQRKTPAELEAIRSSVRIAEGIFERAHEFIAPGSTEREIAAFMQGEAKRAGVELAWEPAVCPAVFTGPDTAGAHYGPTGRKVEPGHLLNMDFGVKVDGYCSDLQRTFYVLAPGETGPPEEVLRGFRTVADAIDAARAAMKPGVQGVKVDDAARRHVVSSGYEEFPHGLGHQVGRFAHDGTALLGPPWEKYAGKPFQTLEEGMVFTLEPRLAVPGRGIATIEEMVVVTRDGAEYLSTPQKELGLIRS